MSWHENIPLPIALAKSLSSKCTLNDVDNALHFGWRWHGVDNALWMAVIMRCTLNGEYMALLFEWRWHGVDNALWMAVIMRCTLNGVDTALIMRCALNGVYNSSYSDKQSNKWVMSSVAPELIDHSQAHFTCLIIPWYHRASWNTKLCTWFKYKAQ